MAVELRCPECRTKLRLKTAPEAGTEVECPKCGTVFPAPEPEPEEGSAPPKKKKAPAAEGSKKGAADQTGANAPEKPKSAADKGAGPKAPKKRKAKKKETSKAALIGVICAGSVMILSMGGVLIWYFTRTSQAVEMFYYVPEDAQIGIGINLGHAQKYPKFYKSSTPLQAGTDFKVAGDAIAKAAGTELDGLMDYVVRADSATSGRAIVFRTKAEFDDGAFAKIPGAEKTSLGGTSFYLAPILPEGAQARVFAPTKRLIVICPVATNEDAFKKILKGHSDSREKTLGVRMGDLGKRVTRGTYWYINMNERPEVAAASDSPPPAPPAAPPPSTPGAPPVQPKGGGGGRRGRTQGGARASQSRGFERLEGVRYQGQYRQPRGAVRDRRVAQGQQ